MFFSEDCLKNVKKKLDSKTCLKRNTIVPVFFFRFTKGCVLIKQSTKI